MPRFAANLTMLFTDRPFLERFEAAARCGFRAVEYMFPYQEDVDGIAKSLERLGMTQVLFNLPAGDWTAGDRGIAVNPGRREEFRRGVAEAVEVARRLGCRQLNCLVGKRIESFSEDEQWRCLVDNIRYAARQLEAHNITMMVEPINTYDVPGFFLHTSSQGARLLDEVGVHNVRLQYDVYHMQRMEGNLAHTIARLRDRIGHVQIADSPDRHEPGTGEINFSYVLRHLDTLGYKGYVGLEYRPATTSEASFGWIEAMGFRRSY
jgi:hydroxypyruvate isomerase